MLDLAEQASDRMALGGCAQILCGHVQVDLRTRDQSMPEQVADRDEADAFAHEMRGEGVSQPMRTQGLREPGPPPERAHALVDGAATQGLAEARTEERCRRQCSPAHL